MRLLPPLLSLILFLSACAGSLPVPGGTDSVNESFYSSREDLLTRLDGVVPGMPENIVFRKLGRSPADLDKLSRAEVISAHLGTTNVPFTEGFDQAVATDSPLQQLYGYKLDYKAVEREHGFTSPIRMRTDEEGFSYTVTLIFLEGRLHEYPILAGGDVQAAHSQTIFDFLSPGMIVSRALP